jgi:tetratricopeptide (TPR) repeat protein
LRARDLESAEMRLRECEAVAGRIGDDDGLAHASANLARIHLLRGDVEEARRRCWRSLQIRNRLGERGLLQEVVHLWIEICVASGDVASALLGYERLDSLDLELSTASVRCETLTHIAAACEADGQYELAASALSIAIGTARRFVAVEKMSGPQRRQMVVNSYQLAMLRQDEASRMETLRQVLVFLSSYVERIDGVMRPAVIFEDYYDLACLQGLLAMNRALQPDERRSELDEAFRWLARALAEGYRDFEHLRRDPDISLLREDPRFDELLQAADGGRGAGPPPNPF